MIIAYGAWPSSAAVFRVQGLRSIDWPEAVLFDCDGVIAETERDGHRVAFNEAFQLRGKPDTIHSSSIVHRDNYTVISHIGSLQREEHIYSSIDGTVFGSPFYTQVELMCFVSTTKGLWQHI